MTVKFLQMQQKAVWFDLHACYIQKTDAELPG